MKTKLVSLFCSLLLCSSTKAFLPRNIKSAAIHKRTVEHERIDIFQTGKTLTFRGGSVYPTSTLSAVPDPTIFNNAPLVQSSAIYIGLNALGFLISVFTGSHLHLDLIGTGAFAVASIPSLISSTCSRITLSAASVTIWGTKLAGFLFFRALKLKTDSRLEETLSSTSGTAVFWTISLIWGLVCSLPHTLGTTSSAEGNPVTLAIGFGMYALGSATETKSDFQKWIYKQNNPGKYCNDGLWSVSQHPNFFGNLLMWSGILVMNADALIDTSGTDEGILATLYGSRRLILACLSPLFLWTLFSGQANGDMTNAVELAQKKYGSDEGYLRSLELPKIVPNLLAWLKKLFT